MSSRDRAVPALSTEELRAAVREVLHDVLPAAASGAGRPLNAGRNGMVEEVSLRTDGDLDAFVRRIAGRCEDPAQRAALREGRGRFRLLAGSAGGAGPGDRPVLRVEKGAVTERRVKQAAAEGARLVVGPRAVLTPLARERARSLGVVVEKEG